MKDIQLIIEEDEIEKKFYVSSDNESIKFITYGDTIEEAIHDFFQFYEYSNSKTFLKQRKNKHQTEIIKEITDDFNMSPSVVTDTTETPNSA